MNTKKTYLEDRIFELLCETLGGHEVRIIRKGVGSMCGFSISNRRTIAIRDLIEVMSSPPSHPDQTAKGDGV